jgi:acyl-CoA reductase-like NAD-dependent aldehyde dehydrogenase
MILKPSEIAPLSGMLFAQMIHDAGFPAGVFNLVNGDGPGVGTDLSGHPDVEMISFTGSTRAGKLITKNAADTIKRVCLELGGKGGNIIFADAYPNAVRDGVRNIMSNAGQSCDAPTLTAFGYASAKIILPPFPPSSKQTLLIVSAAFLEISLPARVEPVKETISISG